MTIKEEMNSLIKESMKNQTDDKNVLRVAMAEINLLECRKANPTEDEFIAAVRKVSNTLKENVTSGYYHGEALKTLEKEIEVLDKVLPQQLNEEQILELVKKDNDLVEKVKVCTNLGQAVGMIHKYLKANKANYDAKLVNPIVEHLKK